MKFLDNIPDKKKATLIQTAPAQQITDGDTFN